MKLINKISTISFTVFCYFVVSASWVQAVLINPLAGTTEDIKKGVVVQPELLIARVVRAALSIAGILALIYFVIGGFYFLTSAGNAERVKKGRAILVWASIGLVLAFTSYAIISFLIVSFENISK